MTRTPRLLVLAIGPILTAYVLAHAASASPEYPVMALVALAVWSPLFFSVPALLLQNERDEALPHLRGLWAPVRALLLTPYLMTRSTVRLEATFALASWLVAVVMLAAPASVAAGQMF